MNTQSITQFLTIFAFIFFAFLGIFFLSYRQHRQDMNYENRWDTCVKLVDKIEADPNNTQERSELLKSCFGE